MPFFYICACKSISIPNHLASFLESDDSVIPCLVAAVRIRCQDFDEAERVVAKAQEQLHESMPKKMKDHLSEMTDEERWTVYASVVDANMVVNTGEDVDEAYRKAIQKIIHQDEHQFIEKRVKEKLRKSEWPSVQAEADIKYLKESIEQYHSLEYEYPIFSEQEALEKWDAVDLAAAQHCFERRRHSNDD